jgi:hypothetical protein
MPAWNHCMGTFMQRARCHAEASMRVCLRTLQYVTLNLSQVRWRSGGHEAGSFRNLCVAGSTAMRRLLLRLKSWGRAMSTFCLLTLSCTFDWGAPMANVRQQSTPSCRFQGFQSHLNRGAMDAATSVLCYNKSRHWTTSMDLSDAWFC